VENGNYFLRRREVLNDLSKYGEPGEKGLVVM
jgi:hypothetical protein